MPAHRSRAMAAGVRRNARGDEQDVEIGTAKGDAGRIRHRQYDLALQSAIRRVARKPGTTPDCVPDEAFGVGLGSIGQTWRGNGREWCGKGDL